MNVKFQGTDELNSSSHIGKVGTVVATCNWMSVRSIGKAEWTSLLTPVSVWVSHLVLSKYPTRNEG